MSDSFTPLEKLRSKIMSISPEIIQQTASKYFKEENFRQIILGNKKVLKPHPLNSPVFSDHFRIISPFNHQFWRYFSIEASVCCLNSAGFELKIIS